MKSILMNPVMQLQSSRSAFTYFPAHKTHRDFFVRNFRKK